MPTSPSGTDSETQVQPGPRILPEWPGLDEPVIVLTAARSGSTLLRRILDAHPDLACPPETNVLRICESLGELWGRTDPTTEGGILSDTASASVRGTIDSVFSAYLLRRGKRRWCEKSLGSVQAIQPFLSLYPKAKFLCLYRHCMDMVDSALEATPWGLSGYGFEKFNLQFPGNSVAALATYWYDLTAAQLDFEEQHPEKCHRIYYEELTSNPEHVCKEIFSFIGVDHVDGITERCLDTHRMEAGPGDHKVMATSQITTGSVGRGMRVPSDRLPGPVLQMINRLLAKLGYAVVDEQWINCARIPAVLPGREDPSAADAAARLLAAEMLDKIDQTLQERVTPRLKVPVPAAYEPSLGPMKRIGIVAYCGVGAQEARVWELDLRGAEVRADVYAGLDDLQVDWLLTGDAGTWNSVLAGEQNLATSIRSRALRYISFESDEGERERVFPQVVNDRMSIIRSLLDQHSERGSGKGADGELALVSLQQ